MEEHRYPIRTRTLPAHLQRSYEDVPVFRGRGRGRGASALDAVGGLQRSRLEAPEAVINNRSIGRLLIHSTSENVGRHSGSDDHVARVTMEFEECNTRYDIKDSSSDPEGSGSSEDESKEMMLTMEQRHQELAEQMEVMKEQGRQMEMAMQGLARKQREEKKRRRRETIFPPVMSSTAAYHQRLDSDHPSIPPVKSSAPVVYGRMPGSDDSGTPHSDRGLRDYQRKPTSVIDNRGSLAKNLTEKSPNVHGISGSAVKDESNVTVDQLKSAWRRDLKIKGKIGKGGDKENKLDYILNIPC